MAALFHLHPLRRSGPRRIARLIVRQLQSQAHSLYQAKSVIEELEQRGFVAALTSPKLHQHVKSPTTIYAGVDPSASSLHVGNLLPLLGLLHFQAKGHQSICLIGGATGSIGDPSGRSTERKALSMEELQVNVDGITSQIHRFFDTGSSYLSKRGVVSSPTVDGGNGKGKEKEVDFGVKVVNNLDWTKGVSLLEFLRNVGKVARVSTMLSRDSVKNRLTSDSGISYTEFTYQLLQAFDFSHLHSTHGCRIQMGGSDQWGNIVAGIDLIKRLDNSNTSNKSLSDSASTAIIEDGEAATSLEKSEDGPEAYGITIPLLTTSTGEKFGKSAGNAVWLDEKRTSAAEFYQFFLRTTDEDVGRYLRLFTFLPLNEIEEVLAKHSETRSERAAQKLLASEVTELVHGATGLSKALTAAQVLYSTSSESLKSSDVLAAFEDDKRFHRLTLTEVEGVPISKLVTQFGLCSSRGEANRLIGSSALSINGAKPPDPRQTLTRDMLVDDHIAILRVGSKRQIILYLD